MQHTSVEQPLLAVSLRDEISTLRPSAAARKIVRFCLADAQTALAAESFHGVAEVHARIRAAGRVVSGLHYREKAVFREAALEEVRKLLPNVSEDRCASQIRAETLKVFDHPKGSSPPSENRDDVAYARMKTLANDGVTHMPVETKVGLELPARTGSGSAFPWRDEVELCARELFKVLRDCNRGGGLLHAPALIAGRRAVTHSMPQSGEAFDDALMTEARSWQPLVAEDVYEILGMECALVGESVMIRGSDPALALCELLESTLQRWKDESVSNPDAAPRLARDLAPLCGHITLLFYIFPELRSSRFEAIIGRERESITSLIKKAMEGGAASEDTYSLSGSLKIPISLPMQPALDGFRSFLRDSSPRDVTLGIGEWWSFLRTVLHNGALPDGTPSIQPFVTIFKEFLTDQGELLARRAEGAFQAIRLVRESADEITSEEFGAAIVAYSETYSTCCQGIAVLREKPLDELLLSWDDKEDKTTDPTTEDLASSEIEEQSSGDDDTTLPFVPVYTQAFSNLEQVRNGLEKALGNLVTMCTWAANQLKLSIAEQILPPEALSSRVLLDILRHDSSNDPPEAQWAYAMQTLQLLATPEVQRAAHYGGVHHSTIVQAMREVVARQRGFSEVPDILSNLEG